MALQQAKAQRVPAHIPVDGFVVVVNPDWDFFDLAVVNAVVAPLNGHSDLSVELLHLGVHSACRIMRGSAGVGKTVNGHRCVIRNHVLAARYPANQIERVRGTMFHFDPDIMKRGSQVSDDELFSGNG